MLLCLDVNIKGIYMPDLKTVQNWPEHEEIAAKLNFAYYFEFKNHTLSYIFRRCGDALTPKNTVAITKQCALVSLQLESNYLTSFLGAAVPQIISSLSGAVTPKHIAANIAKFHNLLNRAAKPEHRDILAVTFAPLLKFCGWDWVLKNIIPISKQLYRTTKLYRGCSDSFIKEVLPLAAQLLGPKLTPDIIVPLAKHFDQTRALASWEKLPAFIREGSTSFINALGQQRWQAIKKILALQEFENFNSDREIVTLLHIVHHIQTALNNIMPQADAGLDDLFSLGEELDFYKRERAALDNQNYFNAICEVAIAHGQPMTMTQYEIIKNMLAPIFSVVDNNNALIEFDTPFGFEFEFDSTNPHYNIGHLSKAEASPAPCRDIVAAQQLWDAVQNVIAYMNVGLVDDPSVHSEFLTCHLNIGLTYRQAQAFTDNQKIITEIIDLDAAPGLPLERLLSAHTPDTYLSRRRCQFRTDKIKELPGRQISHRIENKADAIAAPHPRSAHRTPLSHRIERAQFVGWLTHNAAFNRLAPKQLFQIRDIMYLIHVRHGGNDFTKWPDKFSSHSLFRERHIDNAGSFTGFADPVDQAVFEEMERGHRRRGPRIAASLSKFKTTLTRPNADIKHILTSYHDRLLNELDDRGPQTTPLRLTKSGVDLAI